MDSIDDARALVGLGAVDPTRIEVQDRPKFELLCEQLLAIEEALNELKSVIIPLAGDGKFVMRERAQPMNRTLRHDPVSLADRASAVYRERRARVRILGDACVATGPAWDILLDLFASEDVGRKVSITDAAIAACCPGSTASRWIQVLVSMDLIGKEDDRSDNRRIFLSLTKAGREKIRQCLSLDPVDLDRQR